MEIIYTSNFHKNGSNAVASHLKHVGKATYEIPSSMKNQEVTVAITIHGAYHSGNGYITNLSRTIEYKVKLK